ncbi:maleylpyruvate isomerase family mycothiol-dependent enzyme [Streptomyces ochraceiscleroticus]|uniref:Maleylpyruvate isomerase family mycothiol-dependent enzyme n=1 Tax=Streptomyces ochraceiscleroticus TaxID=47761 RepID=A0ABW1MED6_9ACTN|nr:maleylpyruvate isomerase family mycothiol-dependent enzyme [Streptomyces ochraceiscleroticus]
MTRLGHERYCEEILVQTGLFREVLRGADLTAKVPTCPEWTVGELTRHVGEALRWMGTTVRTRAREAVPEEDVPGFGGPRCSDPASLDAWLKEGAELTAAALREAGPDTRVWTWTGDQKAGFWARRAVHETVIHRADLAIAARAPYVLAPEVAADTLEEWLEIGSLPQTMERRPELAGLLGPGRTLCLHATDTGPAGTRWLIDLTGDRIAWRRGGQDERAAATLSGPLTDVLLVFYRRLPADTSTVTVQGDRGLFDEWLGLVSFG